MPISHNNTSNHCAQCQIPNNLTDDYLYCYYFYSHPYIFLSGMKLKTQQGSCFDARSPFNTQRFDPPIYLVNSIDRSVKKASSSTYLTERSNSRNKVLIPNSQKLASFFGLSRPYDSQKSYSTTSTENKLDKKRGCNEGQEKKPTKIEFLKYNVNRDYFDEDAENNLKGRYERNERNAKNIQITIKSPVKQEDMRSSTNFKKQSSYKSQTLLRCNHIQLPKVKTPKILVGKVFTKVNEKRQVSKEKCAMLLGNNEERKGNILRKGQTRNQFEYTFGLNY